jgi:hypothetical protein
MAKINKLQFEGRVLGEVRSKTFGSGKTVKEWAMGVYAGKNEDGSYKKASIQVKYWGDTEPVKNTDIVVSGRLGAEVWNKEGKDQSKITIVCESWHLAGQAQQQGAGGDGGSDDLPF